MTISEVTKVRDSFLRKRELTRKDTADMIYRLGILITNGTATIFSKDVKPVQFLDIFQDLFKEESQANTEEKIKAQTEINKQHMKEYANRINSQMVKDGGENI